MVTSGGMGPSSTSPQKISGYALGRGTLSRKRCRSSSRPSSRGPRQPGARHVAERCTRALVNICDDVELNALGECDVLDYCEEAIEMWAVDFKLCKVCKKALLDRQVEERRRVWDMLPGVFDMTVGECGFTITSTVESSW